jgi:hypothetical protein
MTSRLPVQAGVYAAKFSQLLKSARSIEESIEPFFVAGSGRCGTTLLRRLLWVNLEIHIPPRLLIRRVPGDVSCAPDDPLLDPLTDSIGKGQANMSGNDKDTTERLLVLPA